MKLHFDTANVLWMFAVFLFRSLEGKNTSQDLVMLNPPPDSLEGFIRDNKGKTAKGYVQAGVVICMKR